jgi:hypothetical protein
MRKFLIAILFMMASLVANAQIPDTLGRTFTTELAPIPERVVLVSPQEGFKLIQQDPVADSIILLRWNSAVNAEEYEIWVTRDGSDYVAGVYTEELSYELSVPFGTHIYRWTIRGVNEYGTGEWAGN